MGRTRARVFGVVGICTTLFGVVGLQSKSDAASLPEVNVADLTVREGDAGIAAIPVPVTLSSPTNVKVKVPFSVIAAPDGVTDPADFKIKKGQLTFAPGKTSAKVDVTSIGDTVIEPDQHVQVKLGTPVGGTATVADGMGEVTLTDDDTNPVPGSGVTVSVGDVRIVEGDQGSHVGFIPVILSRPATVVTKVGFTIDCQTLLSLRNIQILAKGTLSFPVNQRVRTVKFSIAGDHTPDEIRDISLNVQSKLATVQVLDNRGDATINDDDGSLPHNHGVAVPGFTASPIPGSTSFNEQSVGQIDQVTLTPSGGQPADPKPGVDTDTWPRGASVSYDGRYVAFTSDESDLVAGDTNGLEDVFVLDRATNTIERVSLRMNGTQIMPSDGSWAERVVYGGVTMSANGRYVVYSTWASLDPRDLRWGPPAAYYNDSDVYLYDRVTHTTELVTVDTGGNIIHGSLPVISANGRYVAFSDRTDGDAAANNNPIYVRDRVAGTTTLVFTAARPLPYSMSANGRFLLVVAQGLTCAAAELDVIDLADGSTERVDVNDDGQGAVWSEHMGAFYMPAISDDGRYVGFKSTSWNMVPGVTGPRSDYEVKGITDSRFLVAFVRDRQDLATTIVGTVPDGTLSPSSGWWNQLALSGSGGLLASDNIDGHSGRVYDVADSSFTTFGPAPAPNNLSLRTEVGAMSGDGRYITFTGIRHTANGLRARGELFVQRVS